MVQFVAIGLLLLVTIAVISDRLIDRAAEAEVVGDARRTTSILARAVAERSLTDLLVAGDAGAIDRFDRAVLGGLMVDDVRRIKIWSANGTIVYSDQTELIGQRFDLGEDEVAILRDGGTDAEVSDLSSPENRFEAAGPDLVEVYTRIETPAGTPLLFEMYYSGEEIRADAQQVFDPFRRIMAGSLLVLGVVGGLIIWGLTRRLRRAADERQRLLTAVIEASEAERRRIARDLHDGVVQDIAGTAFTLSAASREATTPRQETLVDAATSLRKSLRGLRSLLVEIHPPDLTADSLGPALDDLVAPAAAAGMVARVDVADLAGVSDHSVQVLWRVAQEAVRNALRHSGGSRLTVDVRRERGSVVLEVADDGVGIDVNRPRPAERLGLRGLASLVREERGTLDVTGGPDTGTVVRLELPA
jgi:two-component system NarL family sensor kinase